MVGGSNPASRQTPSIRPRRAAFAMCLKFPRHQVLYTMHRRYGDMQSIPRLRGLGGKKQAEVKKICGYFEKNRHRMRYDEYLKHGYPIASGVIEGACRHVVKDRLERTGMSWVRQGAQSMLELRCLYLTAQWDAFMTFRVERETQRLYPYRETLQPLSWTVAA